VKIYLVWKTGDHWSKWACIIACKGTQDDMLKSLKNRHLRNWKVILFM